MIIFNLQTSNNFYLILYISLFSLSFVLWHVVKVKKCSKKSVSLIQSICFFLFAISIINNSNQSKSSICNHDKELCNCNFNYFPDTDQTTQFPFLYVTGNCTFVMSSLKRQHFCSPPEFQGSVFFFSDFDISPIVNHRNMFALKTAVNRAAAPTARFATRRCISSAASRSGK